ncbi:hypothetical protein DFH08DRAFT_678260 [Mycena albidolilacea]|uniref:Endonuclease/exonuclease/phosphatase domain-containing protein n=1 Tax=Mycena albidolilacea TaxID=1033008 RepID=A0AAD7F7Q6_9AGAR|nr:hypothetical protein DFH08DRAFT_678260 [Mycena albidolilacea]
MSEHSQPPRVGHQFRIWGQNLNKSLDAQIDLLHHLSPNYFDLALLQEPCCDFRGLSRATRGFVSIYPPSHSRDPRASHLMILVNTRLPAASWRAVFIPSPNITAIDFFGEAFSTIRIINIYNNCDNNASLDVLRNFM